VGETDVDLPTNKKTGAFASVFLPNLIWLTLINQLHKLIYFAIEGCCRSCIWNKSFL